MINKFEAIGIFASVACMVFALFFLRLETSTDEVAITATGQEAAVIVVDENAESENAAVAQALAQSITPQGTFAKLVIDDVVIGSGEAVEAGDTITVNYIGTLQNGQQFDNSYVKGQPFTFTVGEGQVIEGWDEGLVGMQVQGERILVVPPAMAYGSRAIGPIPANSTLVFAVELMDIKKVE